LRKLLQAFLGKMQRLPKRLERAWERDRDGKWVYRLMDHPWINRKPILAQVGEKHGLTYYQVYDQIRGRTTFQPEIFESLLQVYEEFARMIELRLEAMKEERKNYLFSHGRGGRGHIKRLESLPPSMR
ncbi:MAG: hypothetical protein AAF399_29120, partial [Bacteroidota bacterium]